MPTIKDLLEAYLDQDALDATEGRRGVENLAKVCETLGYKDPQLFGTLSNGASIGSVINFLEDNSGAITAMLEWIATQRSPEWKEAIAAKLNTPISTENEE